MTRLCRGPEAAFVDAQPAAAWTEAVPDRIVVFGGSNRTIDLLRLAVIRSDDVRLVGERIDAATRRFVERFAIDYRARAATPGDLEGAAAALLAIGDVERENGMVRDARRRRLPIHVADRALVSDFAILDLFRPPMQIP